MQQKIIILDFGSQTTQLIGRRVRELDTFCEILPYNKFPKDDPSVIGVILSGSPFSVHDPEAFKVDLSQFVGKVPVLGICYGAQFISHTLGGKVEKADSREYGRANLETINLYNPLFKGFSTGSQVWMSHGDTITAIPEGFEMIASTKDVKYAAYWRPTPGPSLLGRGVDSLRPSLRGRGLGKVSYLCGPVPSRGVPHPAGQTVAEELRSRYLRFPSGMERCLVCRFDGSRIERDVRSG